MDEKHVNWTYDKSLTYAEVEIVESCSHQRQDKIGIGHVEVRKPEHSLACQIFILCRNLTDRKHHNDEDWNLDDIVEVEGEKIGVCLFCKIIHGPCAMPSALVPGKVGVPREFRCQTDARRCVTHLINERHLPDHHRRKKKPDSETAHDDKREPWDASASL